MSHIRGAQIQQWLDEGYLVWSSATGRLGDVVGTDGDLVFIRSVKGYDACTTFNLGDPVYARMNERGVIVIYNAADAHMH